MAKISVIGICGVSIFMGVDHFHENGETLIAGESFEEVGGKGINQAIAAKRMGAEVAFLTAVGDDENGKKCKKTADENCLCSHFSVKENKSTPFAVILTDKHGENRVTEFATAELDEKDVLNFESEIVSSDILLLQQEVPQCVNDTAIKLAKRHNVRVILNPAPIRQISDEIARGVYIITPNEHESQAIELDRFKNSIVTLGADGCMINGKTKLPSLKVKPVNTTGAGDTFNGVLSVCVAEGMDLELACKYAVAASGISVTRNYVLNAIPYRNEIERVMTNE